MDDTSTPPRRTVLVDDLRSFPPGAAAVVRVLARWGYEVRALTGCPEVAHLAG